MPPARQRHSIRSGRIVIPCDHNRREGNERHSHVIYSDDRGETWHIGGVAADKTNESAVVELRNGDLLLNMRSYHGRNRRAIQRSHDGGLTWSPLRIRRDTDRASLPGEPHLLRARPPGFFEPRCDYPHPHALRLSKDDGASWTTARAGVRGSIGLLLAGAPPQRLRGVLYERGTKGPYETIVFTRFQD